MGHFKFVALQMGSGWNSGHVAVDEYYSWPEKVKGKGVFLNLDTQNFEEFSREVDGLINELENVKRTGKRFFEKHEKG